MTKNKTTSKSGMAAMLAATFACAAFGAVPMTSEPTFVFVHPERSSFWRTATNNVVTLPITFPSGANSATLAVSGASYAATYANITGSSFVLTLPPPDTPDAENVYDLTLTFNTGVERTAKLGLIHGRLADDEGATRCVSPAGAREWGRMRRRAVIPVPYGVTDFSVSVNGSTVATETGLDGAQGWYVLGGIARGDGVSFAYTKDGTETTAAVTGKGNGYFFFSFK